MEPIIQRIRDQVSLLVQSDGFDSWWRHEKANVGDCVVINNSFMYRDKQIIKTVKSDKYLTIPVTDELILNLDEIGVLSRRVDSKQHNNFIVLRKKDLEQPLHLSLRDAVPREVSQLGRMVFLLIGEVEAAAPVAELCAFGPFRTIILDPAMDQELSLNGDEIRIRDTGNPEALWSDLETLARIELATPLKPKDKNAFTRALASLDKKQHGTLRLPTGRVSDRTLLDMISASLALQARQYEQSLKQYQSDPTREAEFNNMLRIAYNFDSEAGTAIALLISLCDLKPLLFWCTVFDHWKLYSAFEALPWTALNLKPSLEQYGDSIRAARNSRFHHLLPINRKLEADLTGVLLKARKITLFDRYSDRRKPGNTFDFEDKEIVDLLSRFTHVEEKEVGDEFWIKNLDVIRCTADLVSSTCSVLKMLVDVSQ